MVATARSLDRVVFVTEPTWLRLQCLPQLRYLLVISFKFVLLCLGQLSDRGGSLIVALIVTKDAVLLQLCHLGLAATVLWPEVIDHVQSLGLGRFEDWVSSRPSTPIVHARMFHLVGTGTLKDIVMVSFLLFAGFVCC